MKETAFQTADKMFVKWTVFPVRDPVSHRTLGHIAVGQFGAATFCRGVSICSSTQPYDAKEGEARAVGRLVKALFRKTCEPIVRTPEVQGYRNQLKDIESVPTSFVRTPTKGVHAIRGFTLARFLTRVYPFRYKAYYGTKLLPMERKALGV
jgi:hypothetical protein